MKLSRPSAHGRSWSGPAVDCGAANQPARRTTPDDEHLLTSRELTIAQLAAARHLNRVIAQRLFISEKTVAPREGVFTKLSVRSRTQLTFKLPDAPTDTPLGPTTVRRQSEP